MNIEIAPSLLSANFAELGNELQNLEAAGADRIHLDVMDGHYVPNLTFGPPIIQQLRSYSHLPFEVHLMIRPVDRLLDAFIDSGADIILFHPDADFHVHRTLTRIKSRGLKAGLVLNPAQPIEMILPILEEVDQVLIMTVNPGFGGQTFIHSQMNKVIRLHNIAQVHGLSFDIAVDGGINTETAKQCLKAGANVLIAGTAIFKDGVEQYRKNIGDLRHL